MKHAQPRGLRRRRVERLLSKAKHKSSATRRIDILSRHFLGQPYKSNPLIGSFETAEVFTATLDEFDCVTYIETVLALARARSGDEFSESLRKIRYQDGRIEWDQRNHYMTDWIRNNARAGIIKPVTLPGVPVIKKDRILNVVPGLTPQRTCIKCIPKAAVSRTESHLQTGDLMFFVSTRKHLDVFHAGIIVRDGTRALMRHASRSKGYVVEQDLSEFLKANRMTGAIVMRPLLSA